jgi:flavin reductase (DIM6/NTAB) family NADH-FMN oxidoreductase RutF
MSVSPDDFRNALSRFASGVTVITTRDAEGRLHGLTVSAFASVSLDPPLVLISIEKATASHHAFLESGVFAVNILAAEQQWLSDHFASPLEDKFEGVKIEMSENDLPHIDGVLCSLDCTLKQSYDGGDHTIFVGEVEYSKVSEGDPLLYFRSTYRELA